MLSYRHAFHAGNHADVLKHAVLVHCLHYLGSKEKPFLALDTHAGAGLYRLDAKEANKTAEYRDGIARLWQQTDVPAALHDYLAAVAACNPPGQRTRYPGSPWLMHHLARANDPLRFCELHSTDLALLRRTFDSAGRRVRLEQADGFEAMKAALPPPSRRGLVLIDPSYEVKTDYARVVAALRDALRRFATGTYLVWLPFLPSVESRALPERLRKLPAEWLYAALSVRGPGSGPGMSGSAMFVVNPPWTLKAALEELLPWLTEVLRQGDGARWELLSSPDNA